MDQFYVEDDFEEDGYRYGNYRKTRMLYYDQIRSATVLTGRDQVYQLSSGCAACCGTKVEAGETVAKVCTLCELILVNRIFTNAARKGIFNPVIMGLKDATRFCAEVNRRQQAVTMPATWNA